MAGSRHPWRQGLIGLVALAVIVACAIYIRREATRGRTKRHPPTPSAAEQLRRGLARRGTRSDATTVQEWRISARPLLLPVGAPPLLPGLDTGMALALLGTPGRPVQVS